MATLESTQAGVRLSLGRVVLVCMLSSGFYMLYWFYLTWKQLEVETGERHYPVWHVLGVLVPIYGWFVVLRHLRAVKHLQEKVGISPSVNPGRLLIPFFIGNVLQFQSVRFSGTAGLVLVIIGVVLIAVFLTLAQRHLNDYWQRLKGTAVAQARVGVGEVIFVIIGMAYWAIYLLL